VVTGSPFSRDKAPEVRQTLVDTNVKESLSQEQKHCLQNINAINLKIRTIGYLMVFAGNSGETLL
jgi:hypothetical protein